LLDGFSLAAFDIVVSNPPYVGESEEDSVQIEVRKFEPRNAVFAGPTGLEVIERLIPQAREALPPGGWLVFEISGTIADRVRPLLSDWNQVEFRNDLQGIARWQWREEIPRRASGEPGAPARHPRTSRAHRAARRTDSHRGAGAEEISQRALGDLELLQAGEEHAVRIADSIDGAVMSKVAGI